MVVIDRVLRAYRQCENLACFLLKQGPLEAENGLWVYDWSRLRPAAVDILLGEVLRRAFPMLQDLINPEYLAEHDSEIIGRILVRKPVRSATIARVEAHVCWGCPHLVLRVVVRAVLLLTVLDVIAGCDLVVVGVVLFLLPAMTVDAAIF